MKKALSVLAGAVLCATALTTAGTASASVADCASWPTAPSGGSTAVSDDYFGIKVEIRQGSLGGQVGWAQISGATAVGDQVWMDYTAGGPIVSCGPFKVTTKRGVARSKAHYTSSSSSVAFRACVKTVGSTVRYCGQWW
jgi:hypothetical protein